MRKFTAITLVLLCTITFTGQSDELDDLLKDVVPTKLSVEVRVVSDDENTKPLIESYLKRELRSLQDVEIVDTGNRFLIVIVAFEPEYKVSGNKTGYMAAAYRFSRTAHPDNYPHLRDYYFKNFEKIPQEVEDDLWRLRTFSESIYTMGVRFFDTDGLKRECEELVAKFDTKVLELERNRK